MGHFSRHNARSRQIRLRAILTGFLIDVQSGEASIAVVAPRPLTKGRALSSLWRVGRPAADPPATRHLNPQEEIMKAVTIDEGRVAARIKVVDEHLRAENAHDLDATMATLNETPQFKLNNDEFGGQDSVRAFYASLFTAFPDLHFEVTRRYVSDEAIIVEATLSGTHKNEWSGIAATGRRVQLPFTGIFLFDENDRLAGERVYCDNALVLRQFGVLPAQ
jgi:steroid delta-isomerase-like uncharacterized protein